MCLHPVDHPAPEIPDAEIEANPSASEDELPLAIPIAPPPDAFLQNLLRMEERLDQILEDLRLIQAILDQMPANQPDEATNEDTVALPDDSDTEEDISGYAEHYEQFADVLHEDKKNQNPQDSD